jgi:glycosyltransferase involved in cell wall biosynthesis
MQAKNFVVVAHKFHTTPDDDFVLWLNEQGAANVLYVCHSFSDAPDRRSWYRWYRGGALIREKTTADYGRLPEPLVYVKEMIFTLWWVLGSRVRWDRYLGMDGLCSLFGLVLRALGRVGAVMYWSIDLVPTGRFPNRWKDRVYERINRFAGRHSDEMWDITQLMVDEKRRLMGLTSAHYRFHRIVPLGVWTERIERFDYDECDQHTAVFMGHLLEKQGVQLVLRATPRIIERVPDFRFKVLGSGAYDQPLRRLAAELGIEAAVDFVGRVERDQDIEDGIARCAVALAPYIRSLDTFTQFGADPGKLKVYLGCGVPILTTDVPWTATEIEARGCGAIISEDLDDIADQVVRLMTDGDANQACRRNALAYALEWDYRRIFEGLDL